MVVINVEVNINMSGLDKERLLVIVVEKLVVFVMIKVLFLVVVFM